MQLYAWVLSTKFYNKTKKKSIPGKTRVYILGEDKIRLDVYDPFGFVTVGNLVINGEMMSLDVINGKNYRGPTSREKIKELLKVDLNPKDLFSVFTQNGFEDAHWSCSVEGQSNFLKECYSREHKVVVKWSGIMTQTGTEVLLDHSKASLKFKVKSFKSHSSYKESLFDL